MLKVITKGCEPTRGSKYSAAVDLYASEDCIIAAGETKIIGLGVCIDIDNWFRKHKDFMNETYYDEKIPEFKKSNYLELHPRSSLRAKGLISNTGIIDLDYENEIKIIIHNPIKVKYQVDEEDFSMRAIFTHLMGMILPRFSDVVIKKGDKIAQILLKEHKSYLFNIESDEERIGGFGSTGE